MTITPQSSIPHSAFPTPHFTRRRWLHQATCGFGSLALADLLMRESRAATTDRSANPFAALAPHFEPRAKRVIFLYMPGGPSHVDLLDPKPRLEMDNGKDVCVIRSMVADNINHSGAALQMCIGEQAC